MHEASGTPRQSILRSRTATALLCLLPLVFASCGDDPDPALDVRCPWQSPEDLLRTSLADFEGEDRAFSVTEMREDIACLQSLFENQYVAAEYYETLGISLPGRARQLLSEINVSMSPDRLMDRLLGLHRDAYDSHLSYVFDSGKENLRKTLYRYEIFMTSMLFTKQGGAYVPVTAGAADASAAITQCDGMAPFPVLPQGDAPRYAFVGQYPDDDLPGSRARCTDVDGNGVHLDIHEKTPDALSEELRSFSFEFLDGPVLYVRIPMMNSVLSFTQQLLLGILAVPGIDFPLLFDLRQNPGGSSGYAWNIAALVHSRKQTFGQGKTVDMKSLYSTASSANGAFLRWKRYEEAGDPKATGYGSIYDEYITRFNDLVAEGYGLGDVTVEPHEFDGRTGFRLLAYRNPIVLLVDKGCASACEDMISVLRDMGNVKLVGTHSMGAYAFGNVGLSVLPNTRIRFNGGWRQFEDQYNPVEGLGFAPDFYIPQQDMLPAALEYLRSLLSGQ